VLRNQDSQVNILLLGKGGEGHEGGELTDSILFVSLNLANNSVKIIPIARDIWLSSAKAKINSIYYYGNQAVPGSGIEKTKLAVAEFLDVPIHYAVVLDFQGFVKAVDAVGGLDVEVDNTFDDYKYPIPGKETAEPESSRYEHVHFDKGPTHMDGATALKYARSRHALGDEGTDFARGVRQEKIIVAFRNKLLSTKTLLNTETLSGLRASVEESLDSDIDSRAQGSFFKVFLSMGNLDKVSSFVLTDYLTSPKDLKPYGGQWVLIPTPNLESLQIYVKNKLLQ
jgi:LCP family protein required for cell wall assembly